MTKTQKIIISVFSAVLVMLLCVLAFVVAEKPTSSFSPKFENNAVSGVPENIDDIYNYASLEIPIKGEKCVVAMCSSPRLSGKELELAFTNDSENTVFVLAEVYDASGKQVGQTGILRQGEYVKTVALKKEFKSSDMLTVKILTFRPETYYSLGTVSADIYVY